MVTHFCCCCNLRSGSIVFAWLQLIFTVITISSLAYQLAMLYPRYLGFYNVFLDPILGLVISIQVIKMPTCFSLIWGLIKNNRRFYEPWLFVQGAENVLLSLSVICALIVGISAQASAFAVIIPLVVINGLSWYFLVCICALYDKDTNISPTQTNGDNKVLTVTSSVC